MKNISDNSKNNSGFVALFAVLVSAIVLTITLGIANISYKEVLLTSQARDANFAFFAADTGAECALYGDISLQGFGYIDVNGLYSPPSSSSTFSCIGSNVSLTGSGSTLDFYRDIQTSSAMNSCAHVTVDKNAMIDPDGPGGPLGDTSHTRIESLGYNASCADIQNLGTGTSNLRIVERAIRVTYPN